MKSATTTTRRPEAGAALAVGLFGGLGLALLTLLVKREPSPRGDDLIYEEIARHPFGVHTYPFGYRFGLPAIVHVLPFSHTVSFVALAWLGAAAAGAVAF